MKKNMFFRTLSALIILSLLIIPVFSGCKTEAADAVNTAQEEPAVETEQEVQEQKDDAGSTEQAVEDKKEEIEKVDEAAKEPEENMETAEESAEQEEDVPEESAQIMDITPAEVYEIMENQEDYLIVDVRTKEEYDEGHLEGAVLLPVQELEDRLGELPTDKPIIVYCRSGSRSRTAAEILINNGFTMVYDMGGISDWISEGYPVIVEE